MRAATAVALPWVLLCGRAQEPAAAPEQPPNIVFVLADDLGYGELGCYGQQKIATPRLDRLAAQGIRLLQHYAGAPVCAPSRCVLMTGRHGGHATIRDNEEHQPEGQLPIGAAEVTLAELLAQHGYATGCFGKWGLGYPGSEGDPLRQGFQRCYGYNCQRHAHTFHPTWLWDDDRKQALPGNDGVRGTQYSADLITQQARAFVRSNKDRPFFLYVPFTLPHLGLQVPDDWLARYRGSWEETPFEGTSYQPHATPRACYAAMIAHLDHDVGEILDELDAQGLANDTLVVFTSDNGPTHLAEVDTDFFASTGGLRGRKGSLYEGGIRVPAIVRWPGHVAAGTRSDFASGFQDWMPTLAALAGASAPAGSDGVSLLPTLRGAVDEQVQRDCLVWDLAGYGGEIAVRAGRWKAVWNGLRKNPDATAELYDLDADPQAQHDLAAQEPAVVARLAAIAAGQRTEPAFAGFRFGHYADEAAARTRR